MKEGYAKIMRMNLDGTEREEFASGIRNTVGFDWHPVKKRTNEPPNPKPEAALKGVVRRLLKILHKNSKITLRHNLGDYYTILS